MNEEEKLQRLLRLKRHEHPPEGFAEEFLEKFQRRQRTELVRRSALSILCERIQAWLDGLRRPAVIWSAAGVYAAIMLALWLVPRPTPASNSMIVVGGGNVVTAPQVGYTPNAPPGTVPVSSGPTSDLQGKRRTIGQDQDKESIIGPEEKPAPPAVPPLRDL